MIVDAMGLACPMPVVNTKKAIEGLTEPEEVKVLVDNDVAVQNLLRFAAQKGFDAKGTKLGEGQFEVVIAADGGKVSDDVQEAPVCAGDAKQGGLVVVLSSNQMGSGEEKLGKSLMKAFVFALTKQDNLPEAVLLYNSGAYLSCEDADTLEDLKLLEAEGVRIATCGTCLDFYGLKEKLAVGEITNMYDIVETQEKARLIIRP